MNITSLPRTLSLLAGCCLTIASQAQISRLGENVEYKGEVSVTGATGEYAPLWLTANKDGLSSVENTSAYVRGAIERKIECDSTHAWKFGYGADFAVPYNFTSPWVIQQLYGEAQWLKFRLGVGSKVRDLELKNDALTSGGMTFSHNARPIPQVRVELADWWNFTGRAHFLAFKGHIAYGMHTDGRWQEEFAAEDNVVKRYSKNVLYHSKAGYFKVGDERRFPLTGTFGLEMAAEFGGEVWGLADRGGTGNENFESHQVMGHSFKNFLNAFIPGGSDVNDGDFANIEGNQLGSWTFSLDWNTPQWGVRAYLDHFFEDHSMMFFQYGWRDNLIGVEARLPKNPYVSEIVYENLNTTDQSGAVYHDYTSTLPFQISGKDTYYNHHIYGAYQHWGQVQGNPLIVSPIYNANHNISIYHNRISAHHIGLSGNPHRDVSWRALVTYQHSLGTYDILIEDRKSVHLYAEANYAPQRYPGWKFSLGLGCTTGSLFKPAQGFCATITKTGIIKRRHK